jgi:hypothetical protein
VVTGRVSAQPAHVVSLYAFLCMQYSEFGQNFAALLVSAAHKAAFKGDTKVVPEFRGVSPDSVAQAKSSSDKSSRYGRSDSVVSTNVAGLDLMQLLRKPHDETKRIWRLAWLQGNYRAIIRCPRE